MNSLLSFAACAPFRQSSRRLFSVVKSAHLASFHKNAGHEGIKSMRVFQSVRNFSDVYYSRKHEYIILEPNSVGRVGISSYAQDKLGDVVYVQLPEIDRVVEMNEDVAAVESVKAASEVYSPVSGTITEVNKALEADCALINKSPLEKGWIFKVSLSDKDELKSLMNQVEYDKYLKNEADEEDEHH